MVVLFFDPSALLIGCQTASKLMCFFFQFYLMTVYFFLFVFHISS